ncbi:palmdelphin isoform 1-T1 [Acanthopagrus schlegelii]
MEESDLLNQRLQAITDKHRIQEDIRQKKLEMDQEKIKLQHLKKKALREQWLLQDSASHNATHFLTDQQQTRALQLSIHRIETEVEALEREESMISTNESFILNRLKAVEKSSDDIIKEVQDSFVPEPLMVTTVIPDVPKSLSPPYNKHSEPNTPRKAPFAMEVIVSKNLSTGESTVLSTASVLPEEIHQHSGLKVYNDGRKCVYALNSQEGSCEQSCGYELSANEVKHLLRSTTMQDQVHQSNYHQNHNRREDHCFYKHQDETDRALGCDLRHPGSHCGNHLPQNNSSEKDLSSREKWQRKPGAEHRLGPLESHYRRQEERNNQSNLREGHHHGNYKGLGNHYDNQRDCHYSSYQLRNCVQEDRPASGINRSNSLVSGGRANGCPPPRSHDQEVLSTCQPLLCYTPANYVALRDYISVEEEELYHFNPPSYHNHDGNPPTAVYDSAQFDRGPSPLFRDDTPYTILNTMETIEPITAIFMGFQTAQDVSGQGREFEGSMKAELVIIEDNAAINSMREKKSQATLGGNSYPTGSSANGIMGHMKGIGDKRMERQVGPDIREIPKKHRLCCTVC